MTPRVQDRLEMMDWPKGDGSLAKRGPERSGWHERVECPGPSDWVGVMKGKDCGGKGLAQIAGGGAQTRRSARGSRGLKLAWLLTYSCAVTELNASTEFV